MVRARLLIALVAALLLTSCATQPTNPPGHQDPEIWRPENVEYPLP